MDILLPALFLVYIVGATVAALLAAVALSFGSQKDNDVLLAAGFILVWPTMLVISLYRTWRARGKEEEEEWE